MPSCEEDLAQDTRDISTVFAVRLPGYMVHAREHKKWLSDWQDWLEGEVPAAAPPLSRIG